MASGHRRMAGSSLSRPPGTLFIVCAWLVVSGCSEEERQLGPCPCPPDYNCDQVQGICVPPRQGPAAPHLRDLGPGVYDDDGGMNDAEAMSSEVRWVDRATDFGVGTFDDVRVSNGFLALVEGATVGTYRSQIYNPGTPTQFQDLRWLPEAPYSKPLPQSGEAERGYSTSMVRMLDNVLLLGFDGTTPVGPGIAFSDGSPEGNDLTMQGGVDAHLTSGRVGTALAMGTNSHLSIPFARASNLQFGETDFTFALWTRSTQGCDGNKVYMGADGVGDDRTHLWLGCSEASARSSCAGRGGRAGGTLRSRHARADGPPSLCGTTRIDDGRWHHLAMVKRGHPDAVVQLFVDGRVEDSESGRFERPLDFPATQTFTVGAFSGGGFQAAADFDEVGVWRRALTEDEIWSVYSRGALRLAIGVRVCVEPDCSDEPPFTGPGGRLNRGFVDAPQAAEPGAWHPLNLQGRFIQYQVQMETDIEGSSPLISMVEIQGERR